MCSTRGARAFPRAGCPIQKSPDHRSLPTPRPLSQVAASFFGSWCLGIHLGPLLACSTYNHSSIAEEPRSQITYTLRKRIQKLLFGILEISLDLFGCQCAGGDERIRTADPLLAKQVLSQLSYIPWGALFARYSDTETDVSLRVRSSFVSAGGCQTLKSEEWERQEQNLGCLLVNALHSIERNETDFHRELSRLPRHLWRALALSGRLLFNGLATA